MKYRIGFVTNSSSSSFLIFNPPELKSIKDTAKFLKLSVYDYNKQYINKIFKIPQQLNH